MQRKLKICFFSPNALPLIESKETGFGGGELDMWHIAQELSKDENFEVYFSVLGEKNEKRKIEKINLVIIENYFPKIRRGNYLRYLWRIISVHAKIKADIYFSKGSSLESVLCFFAAKIFRKKFIFKLQHEWETNFEDLKDKMLGGKKWLAPLVVLVFKNSKLIAQTKIQQELLKRNYNLNSEVIYNSHPIMPFEKKEREFILWVSRMVDYKKPEVLINLAKKFPDEKFVMIGQKDNEYKDLAQKIDNEISALKNVRLIPGVPRDKIEEEYFQKAKIFVLTSEREGLPNVLIDAMKSGTPVLSFLADPDNIIENNKLGFFVKGNFNQLVEKTKLLLEDKKLWEEISARAYGFARNNFNIEKTIFNYKMIFQKL